MWRTPAEAPAALLDDIYEFLEGEIEHLGRVHHSETSDFQEMAERMFEGQRFASEQWDTWFEESIQQIQKQFFGHESHTDSESEH